MKFIYRSIRPKWRNPPIPGQLCPPRQRLALASLPLKFQAGVQCGRDKCLLAILSLGAVASHHGLQQKSVSVSAIAACTRIGQSHGTLVGIRADYRSRMHLYLFPVFGRKRPFQMLVGRLVCAVSATFYLAPPPRCSCSFRPSPPSSSLFRARVAHSLLLLPQYRVVLGRFRFLRNRNWNGLSTRNYLSSFAFLNFCTWHKEPQSRDF